MKMGTRHQMYKWKKKVMACLLNVFRIRRGVVAYLAMVSMSFQRQRALVLLRNLRVAYSVKNPSIKSAEKHKRIASMGKFQTTA